MEAMKLIDRNGQIYIPPKRGQLPRRYRGDLEDTPQRHWRRLAWALLGCAIVSGLIWRRLP
jgi:hypothetical protein